MPLYEYECLKCGERFEVIQRFSDEPVRLHAERAGSPCEGSVRKLLAAPAIQFKGSGWYVTDYGKGGQKPPKETGEAGAKKKAGSASDGSKGAKSGSKSGESKAAKAA